MKAIPADFCPQIPSGDTEYPIVLADPVTAHEHLKNHDNVKGSILITQRGRQGLMDGWMDAVVVLIT